MNKRNLKNKERQMKLGLIVSLIVIEIACIVNSVVLIREFKLHKDKMISGAFVINNLILIFIFVTAVLVDQFMKKQWKKISESPIDLCGHSESLIDYIVESTNSYIIFLDPEYKVISCSESLIKRLGYKDSNQIYKKSIYELGNVSKNKNVMEEIIQKVESTNTFKNVRIFELENETIWFLVNVTRIQKEDKSKEIMLILTDVTKEQRNKEEVVEIVKMRNKVLLTMSHELRTPINGINGSVELLSMSNQMSVIDREHVQNIREASRALLSIVEQATDYNYIQNNEIVLENTPFSINDILEEIRTIVHLKGYEKNIGFCVEIEPDIPSVLLGDVKKICRVLLNLLYNAVKYTEEGCVWLRISKKERDGKIFIQYIVKDTGCGIEKENLEKIFETFYRFENGASSRFSGLGLGLAICQEYVKAMGGTLRCESNINIGSTFWFELETKVLDDEPTAVVKNVSDKNIALVTNVSWKIEQGKKLCRDLGVPSYKICQDMASILNESFTHIIVESSHPLVTEVLLTKFPFQCQKVLVLESSKNVVDGIREADHIIYEPFTIPMMAKVLNAYDQKRMCEEKKSATDIVFKTKGVRALAVDDNAVNLMVVSNILQQYNIEVDEADSGKAAIQRHYEKDYDLIFMDYLMPDMDGVETTKYMRNLNKKKNPVIIALSANVNREIKESFEQAGADYVMVKPLELKELSQVLHRFLPPYKILEEKTIIQEHKDEITFEALKAVLNEVECLNVESGLVYMAGSVENYVRVLKLCGENVREQINHIRAAYPLVSSNDLRIYFHSLKGIFLNVGADKLAGRSAKLEEASLNGNSKYIEENIENYIETVEAFRNKMQMSLALYQNILTSTIPEESYQPIGEEEYKERLTNLIHSIKRFEYNESTEQAEQLIISSKGEKRKCLEQAYEQIQQFQYDNAVELLEQINSK